MCGPLAGFTTRPLTDKWALIRRGLPRSRSLSLWPRVAAPRRKARALHGLYSPDSRASARRVIPGCKLVLEWTREGPRRKGSGRHKIFINRGASPGGDCAALLCCAPKKWARGGIYRGGGARGRWTSKLFEIAARQACLFTFGLCVPDVLCNGKFDRISFVSGELHRIGTKNDGFLQILVE